VQAERFCGAHNQRRVIRTGGNFFVGIARAETAANIEILQIDSRAAQFLYISGQTEKRIAKWIERDDL